MEYPEVLEEFIGLIDSLQGINDVYCGIDDLSNIVGADLRFVDYAHLPAAALMRTDGGKQDENLLQFEFTIDGTPESINSLAFLTWFFRDQSRGGKLIQLRPFALPLQPNEKLHSATLKFLIDCFITARRGDTATLLAPMEEVIGALYMAMDIYQIPTKDVQ